MSHLMMAASGANTPAGRSSDSEEKMLESGPGVTDDEYPAAPEPRRRALSSIALVPLAGLLGFAVYTHRSIATHEVVAAIKDAQQLQNIQIGSQWCPGLNIPGLGMAALVDGARTAAAPIKTEGNWLTASNGGRAYFAEQCVAAPNYNNEYYATYSLLGNTVRFSVDLSGAGCGCNAAFYFVSLKQNTNASECGDYYCDANSVCGVPCAEMDIMEANMYSWHTTIHTADDGSGHAAGYGGSLVSSWRKGQYGPGGTCIDTRRPFDVAVGFPVTVYNTLQSVEVTLSQAGKLCALSTSISTYSFDGRQGMLEVSQAMAAGMTPIVSYWSAESLDWLDGVGSSPLSLTAGRCTKDAPGKCPDSVMMYGFAFQHGANTSPPKVNDPEWKVFPAMDTLPSHDAHRMNAADIGACKAYGLANKLDAFVVWRGECYFRSDSGPKCYAALRNNRESSTYITTKSLGMCVEYRRQTSSYCAPWSSFDTNPLLRYTTIDACKLACNMEPACIACSWASGGPYAVRILSSIYLPCTVTPGRLNDYIDFKPCAR